ncbi:MAG: M48 family metallopeptidase [Ruminococcaceae bacterium]|nr:M48 family metallopeptidase [Oscillospiraceae bacterium]
MEKLYVFGMELVITRKKIKNLYIRIKSGKIAVSAPIRMPEGEIIELVKSREAWIKSTAENNKSKQNELSDGEKISVFGKDYILRLNTERKNGYYFENGSLVLCVGDDISEGAVKKRFIELYRDLLLQILPDVTEKCQKKCGLFANEWRVRDMSTRWGSCNVKEKRIWLSLWLAAKPIECIEATIYHELAHLKVKGHGNDFYKLLLDICPTYRESERILKNK